MGFVTLLFITLALISAVHNAPLDAASTAKPPAALALSTGTSTSSPEVKRVHLQAKRQAFSSMDGSSSEESKESSESSEDQSDRRLVRDISKENSAAVAHQTRNTSINSQTQPALNRDASQPQQPPHSTRGIQGEDSRVPTASQFKPESTTSSTGGASNVATTSRN